MKQILMIGTENSDKAEKLYFHLLDSYPRKTWTFSIQTINDIPIYKFILKGKSEEVYKRKEFIRCLGLNGTQL